MTPDEEQLLRAALHDAVADVVPRDGLAEIRRRTRGGRSTAGSRRWLPVLVGAGAVAATVVVATVAVTGVGDDPEPGPAASSSSGASEAFDPSQLIGSATAAYFIGETPTGPRLHREWQPVSVGDREEVLTEAVRLLAVDEGPEDPDYRTVWPAGSFADARLEADRIVVELGNADALDAPVGITPEEQELGVQQVVYTAEAAVGEALPVTFEWRGAPAATLLGVDAPALVERDRAYDVTAPVNISDPSEGSEVAGSLIATGSMPAGTDAADVHWTLAVPTGDETVVLDEGVAEEAVDPAPFAPGWRTEPIDTSQLDPGDYILTVSLEQPGSSPGSPTVFTDTRTVAVR